MPYHQRNVDHRAFCARPRIPSRRAAPGQKGSGKPRAATSDPNPAGDDTQRPAPRAAPQAPAGRHSSPARLAGARPVPLAGAVQTRWRRPPPLRPSGSSAAPQYGMLDGPEGGRAFPPSVAASRGCHGLGGEAGPWVQRVRADGAALPRPAYLCALLRRQGCRGPELVPGLRDGWKDPNNEFRKNLKLTGVPTLLKYGTPQKLVEEECFKADLVRMLFTED